MQLEFGWKFEDDWWDDVRSFDGEIPTDTYSHPLSIVQRAFLLRLQIFLREAHTLYPEDFKSPER